MTRNTQPIAWAKPSLKDFLKFPDSVKMKVNQALTILAEGYTPDNTKPLTGLGSGVQEIVIPDQTGAYRVVYALKLEDRIWVLHSFKKKSKSGIKTPKKEIDIVKLRIKQIKEKLK